MALYETTILLLTVGAGIAPWGMDGPLGAHSVSQKMY